MWFVERVERSSINLFECGRFYSDVFRDAHASENPSYDQPGCLWTCSSEIGHCRFMAIAHHRKNHCLYHAGRNPACLIVPVSKVEESVVPGE